MRRLIPVAFVVICAALWGAGVIVRRRAVDAASQALWPLQLGNVGPLEAPLGIRLNRFDRRPVTNDERAFSLVEESLSRWISEQTASTSDPGSCSCK